MRIHLLLTFVSTAALALSACSVTERSYDTSGPGSGGGGGEPPGTGGGGGGGSGGAGGGPDVLKEACAAYASAICQGNAACLPYFLELFYGDAVVCTARFEIFCDAFATAPGTSWTPQRIQTCADTLNSMACSDFAKGTLRGSIPECRPLSGSAPTGAPCIDSGQCSGGYCNNDEYDLCGVCSFLAGEGEACDALADCKPGLVCDQTVGTCTAAGAEGDNCSPGTTLCEFPLVCHNGKCAFGAEVGDMCDPMFSGCDFTKGYRCDAQTASCKPFLLAKEGSACGYINGDSFKCFASGTCDLTSTPGICIPYADDNAACKVGGTGPGCLAPAICFNDVCTLPDAGACGP